MLIDPAASIVRDFERRRHVQKLPAAGDFYEYTLAVQAEESKIAVHGRQEPVDAHVPLRNHRMEYTAHPGGRRERRLVRRNVAPRAQQMTMRSQYAKLLRTQHDVTRLAVEEGEQLALIIALVMPPRRR